MADTLSGEKRSHQNWRPRKGDLVKRVGTSDYFHAGEAELREVQQGFSQSIEARERGLLSEETGA